MPVFYGGESPKLIMLSLLEDAIILMMEIKYRFKKGIQWESQNIFLKENVDYNFILIKYG